MVDECRVSCYPVIFFLSHFSIPLYLPLSFLFLFILLLHCPYFKAGWGYATDFGGTDEAYKAEKGISSFVRRRRLTRKQIFYLFLHLFLPIYLSFDFFSVCLSIWTFTRFFFYLYFTRLLLIFHQFLTNFLSIS